ncbi:MAG: hypothetical protein WBS33_10125 [Verrucomicrobiia bacterium]
MQKGDTFLMGSIGGKKKHLWILLSDLNKHRGTGVIVNLTTDKDRSGGDCSLCVGDHPWLTSECWVSYGDAMCLASDKWSKIQHGIAMGLIVLQDPLAKNHLEKIILAAKVSKAFPSLYLKFLD